MQTSHFQLSFEIFCTLCIWIFKSGVFLLLNITRKTVELIFISRTNYRDINIRSIPQPHQGVSG
jgi:hypothetical protein